MADETSQSAQPAQSNPVQEQKTNVMAILSLIFAFLIPLLGIIFGIIALLQIDSNKNQKGKGLAMAGLIVSVLSIILFLIILGIAYTGFLNPAGLLPSRCSMDPGFTCLDYNLKADGTLLISIRNSMGMEVNNVELSIADACTPVVPSLRHGQIQAFTCKVPPGKDGFYRNNVTVKYTQSGGTQEQAASGIVAIRYE
jgi:hypothetical protein